MASLVVKICISLMTNEYFLRFFFGYSDFFICEIPLQVFCPCFHWIVCHFLIDCRCLRAPHIFSVGVLCQIYVLQISFPTLVCLFTLLRCLSTSFPLELMLLVPI